MPALLFLPNEEAYKAHFINTLVGSKIMTFHGVPVKFKCKRFGHAFSESRWDSLIRAKRMDWIRLTLEDQDTSWYQGWSGKRKKHESTRSVSVAYENFVVVLHYYLSKGDLAASFITCYEANRSIQKIRNSPLWDINECQNYLQIDK